MNIGPAGGARYATPRGSSASKLLSTAWRDSAMLLRGLPCHLRGGKSTERLIHFDLFLDATRQGTTYIENTHRQTQFKETTFLRQNNRGGLKVSKYDGTSNACKSTIEGQLVPGSWSRWSGAAACATRAREVHTYTTLLDRRSKIRTATPPLVAHALPMSAKLRLNRPKFGRLRARLCRSGTEVGRMCRSWPNVGRRWPRTWANVGRTLAKLLADAWPTLVSTPPEITPKLVDIGPICPNLGRTCPDLSHIRRVSAKARPRSARNRPKLRARLTGLSPRGASIGKLSNLVRECHLNTSWRRSREVVFVQWDEGASHDIALNKRERANNLQYFDKKGGGLACLG